MYCATHHQRRFTSTATASKQHAPRQATARATASTAYTQPKVPSSKPVRSRKLPPEEHDPEDLSLSVLHYAPLTDPGSSAYAWDPATRLPACYQPCEDADAQAWPEEASDAAKGAGYLADASQTRELIQSARALPMWQLLGLDARYADDFFRGPDYRCAVLLTARLL